MKLADVKGGKNKLLKSAEGVTGKAARKAGKVKGRATARIDDLAAALDETLLNIKTLGLTLKNLEWESGIVPSVMATLQGSVASVDPVRLGKMIDDHPDNEILRTTLKLLQKAVRYKDRLAVFDLKGIEMAIKVGIPPNVTVKFI